MDWDHFDRIPQSVRREPIRMRSGGTFSFRDACAGGVAMAILAACVIAAVMILATRAQGREGPQWAQNDPETSAWYTRQMQPDGGISCCGPADAYWADEIEVKNGQLYAIITDARADAPLGRAHVPVGTRVEIPAHKFNDPRKDPNPTIHGIVFMNTSREVFCYFNLPGDG